MLSQRANYTTALWLEEKKNFCPLLDASFMMLWCDMAYVEMYVNQIKKRALKVLCIG